MKKPNAQLLAPTYPQDWSVCGPVLPPTFVLVDGVRRVIAGASEDECTTGECKGCVDFAVQIFELHPHTSVYKHGGPISPIKSAPEFVPFVQYHGRCAKQSGQQTRNDKSESPVRKAKRKSK